MREINIWLLHKTWVLGGKTPVANHRGQTFLVVDHKVCTHLRRDFVPLLFADPVRILSLRSGVIYGFCDRALTLPSCLVFMWACGFECAQAVRSLVCVPCFVLERGVRIPAFMSWVSIHVGVWTLALHVLSCCVSVRSPVYMSCGVHAVRFRPACIHVMSCVVWHAACVSHWLRAFMLSCLVWTCGLWLFSFAECSCPVLHMAGDLFCWPCANIFVLCEHIAFVLVFCVPCALMSICLDPTHIV